MTRDQALKVSKSLGISVESLRLGLRKGVFPFGTAYQTDKGLWTYVLYPEKIKEYIGESNVHVVSEG